MQRRNQPSAENNFEAREGPPEAATIIARAASAHVRGCRALMHDEKKALKKSTFATHAQGSPASRRMKRQVEAATSRSPPADRLRTGVKIIGRKC
jgi:hypothetical protein